jgi:GNAT superfamily N-acetyltransferase
VPPDDGVAAAEAARAGFTEVAETYEVSWLDAADRPPPRALPDGYELVSRAEPAGSHPMARRNGAEVERRLRQCSLYDPGLDLAVRAPDGTIAAYALFWPDRRTGVGLVEPVRVEDAHAGRGVAGALLRAGLDLLAARGCGRLKVSHETGNEAARRLYHGAGFVTQQRVTIRARPPAGRLTPTCAARPGARWRALTGPAGMAGGWPGTVRRWATRWRRRAAGSTPTGSGDRRARCTAGCPAPTRPCAAWR